jgi:hypothetical protein
MKKSESKTVIILGAGSSYGSTIDPKPPIMKDFIKNGKNLQLKEKYDRLWNFLERIGYNLKDLEQGNPNLEEIYTVLHVISLALWHKNETEFIEEIGQDFWKVSPVYFLESFIIEVLDISSINALKKTCTYHDKLAKYLKNGDCIIDFNYDLIMDSSLINNTHWSEFDGYGFNCYDFLEENKIDYDEQKNKKSFIKLLKLHGSINWKISKSHYKLLDNKENVFHYKSFREKLFDKPDQEYQLKIGVNSLKKVKDHCHSGYLAPGTQDFYDELATKIEKDDIWKISGMQKPLMDCFIVPPTLMKFGEDEMPEQLIEIWSNANYFLKNAERIICIGYSFPTNDVHFTTLFRLAISNNKKRNLSIEIVDPVESIADKLKKIFPNLIIKHAANSLKEFVENIM